ncbi:hypothetical protein SBA_ch1_31480 [Sphingomonas bisphenolicum]|uniref:Transposase n=1 Tax=Sphingomonas bisphenolicum TaxID=296544 RepID=A0ABM7G539_9SPHN|nr:hypothetical protein SBA_ch1_31480 [Sphingomonas bisphenolicum]
MLNAHALHAAAHEVADRIGPIEAAIDDSLAKTAGLLAFMPEARVAARLPVNRRANGTPYRRAKGTPFQDGARLI